MRKRIWLQGIVGVLLNVIFFLLLYFTGTRMPFAILVWAMYLGPAAINSMIFWNTLKGWRIQKQMIVFLLMAAASVICYVVFAVSFENSANYVAFIERSLDEHHIVGELRGEPKGRFFSVVSSMVVFLSNLTVQVYVNGTRRKLTREEIDRIFEKYEK